MLKVQSVDYHIKENAKAHRTDKFEVCYDCDPTPILRRGQAFSLSVTFDRVYDSKKDVVRIFFECNDVKAKNPRFLPSKENTTLGPNSQLNWEKDSWSIQLMKVEGKTIHVQIRASQIIPFATFKLNIDTSIKDVSDIIKWEGKDVYFLFNPWMKGDSVYMPDTKLLDEYVLNDIGKVYRVKGIGKKWVFGQFSAPILPALRKIMTYSNLNFFYRGNPVHLSRELTRRLDSNSEGGVMEGRWDNQYEDGTRPGLWNNSVSIFEDYMNKGGPIKYVQCWIYSAVLVTACRAIGIPCRSVTNYNSGHDTDKSLTIDSYILPDNVESEEDNEDHWNFHVWVDAWMARYDLTDGYGGWQAIDATPQETDEKSVFRCGPASLEAIRKGEIGYNYETQFILSEVNADLVKWTYDKEQDGLVPLNVDKTFMGKVVLTKRPFIYDPNGDSDFQDITDQYKSAEGTKEERLTFYNAVKECEGSSGVYNISAESPVSFCFKAYDTVNLGTDFFVTVSMTNGGTKKKTVMVNLSAASIYYNGVRAHSIKNATVSVDLPPGKTELAKMQVTPDEYAHLLVDFSIIKIHAISKVKEDKYIWAEEDKFSIKMPEISINTVGDLEQQVNGKIVFKMKNPLNKSLTNCKIIYECAGIGRNITVPCKDIKAGGEMVLEHTVKPTASGEVMMTALFESKQVKGINGTADIVIL